LKWGLSRKAKRVLYRNRYQWEGGREDRKNKRRQRWWMYFVFMYENKTMKPVDIVLRGEGGIREHHRRGESN
jgi:hypothetical protein